MIGDLIVVGMWIAAMIAIYLIYRGELAPLDGSKRERKSTMDSTCWVFEEFETGLYTVGFYDPSGKFHPEGDYDKQQAAERVHYLNGGN